MKSYYFTKKNDHTKNTVIDKPMYILNLKFEDFDDRESDDEWKDKSRRLQARRWRKIKHQMV